MTAGAQTPAVTGILPLTPMQEGMLFHALSTPGAATYVQQYTYVLEGTLDPCEVHAAYRTLVARHSALRTGFVWEGVDQPLQVEYATAELSFRTVDLRGLSGPEQDQQIDQILRAERAADFDLGRPPLVRAAVARTAEDRMVVFATEHHLVVDGWSATLLQRELLQILDEGADALQPARPFSEYVSWLRQQPDPAPYWRGLLGDVSSPTPLGVDRRGRVTSPDRSVDWQLTERSDSLDPGGLAAARARGLLPSTLVHAAWALTLARQSDADSVLFGVALSGRPAGLLAADSRVGMFVNTLPFRLTVPKASLVGPWLADVQRRLVEVREREHTSLAIAQDCSGVPRGTPLFESALAFQNNDPTTGPERTAGRLRLSTVRAFDYTSLPVSLTATLLPAGLRSRMSTDAQRFDPEASARMLERFHGYLSALAADLDRPLAAVPEPCPDLPPAAGSATVDSEPVTEVVAGTGILAGSVTAPDGELTGAAMAAGAAGVAAVLASAPHGHVGVAIGASVHLPAALLGCRSARRPVVLLDPRAPAAELAVVTPTILVAGDLVPELPGVVRIDVAGLTSSTAVDPVGTVAQPETAGPHPPAETAHDLASRPVAFRTGETVLAVAPVPDWAVFEALRSGARLRLVDPVLGPVDATGADVVVAAPGLLRQLLDTGWHGRCAIATELLPTALRKDLVAAVDTVVQVHRNALAAVWSGPSEPEHPGEGLPLGRPLHGAGASLVDGCGRSVPADTPGELRVGGLPSGDRARRRPDGSLELVGGEGIGYARVEAALGRLPGVAAVAVVGSAGPEPATAWVELTPGSAPVTGAALRRQLLRVLPAPDLPDITVVRRLPRDPAGRVLRSARAEPIPSSSAEPPTTSTPSVRLAALSEETRRELLAALDAAADHSRLSENQRARVLAWGDGGTAPIPDTTLGALIEAVAAAAPDAIAVDDHGQTVSYGQLCRDARRLARRLQAIGVERESRVAICLPPTAGSVTAVLGVLLAGGAYVPIDVTYPPARCRFIVDDAAVVAAVTVDALRERFVGVPTVSLDSDAVTLAALDATPLDARVDPADAAYILYTSGSTGTPKGVLVEHHAVVDFVTQINAAYRIDAETRLLAFAALTFDVSVFDMFAALTAGATMVLASQEDRPSADRLQRLLFEGRVTAAELPPAVMPGLRPDELPDLRLVSVGGEAPAGALVDAWATPDRQFWNGYGPTETTVAVTLMLCRPPSGGRVPPIGRPMPNHRAYVLDEQQRLVPPGDSGELCVAGPGLARGYLGRPELTAQRFVPDPYAPGERLYRTGDLVRWTDDGVLEFLGRVDRQVKVRGFRIELGEVEAALAVVPGVRQVVVEPWDDASGTRHLVAWITGSPLGLPELRAGAGVRLPQYMLPTRVVHLATLPLTAAGKVDRQALPPPGDTVDVSPSDLPDDPLQAELLTLVSPLVGVATIGVDDDFFAVGGNSLQATQVLSRVRDRFGVEVGLPEFFAEPTVARLAALVAEARGNAPSDLPGADVTPTGARTSDAGDGRPDVAPLAPQQERVWRLSTADPSNTAYHMMMALRVRGQLDVAALRGAFVELARRQTALRTTVEVRDGEPVQVVHPEPRVPYALVDLANEPDPERAAARAVREEYERPFDLAVGPPLRVRVLTIAEDDHVFCWCTHHMLSDGWSVGVQLRELFPIYSELAFGGTIPELPVLPASYSDYAWRERDRIAGAGLDSERGWWRQRLAGAPREVDLRPDHSGAGGSDSSVRLRVGYHSLGLTGELTTAVAAVAAFAQRAGSTVYMVLLTAVAALIADRTGHDDVLVVTPIAGRTRSEWEPLVGFFANRVVLRVDLSGSPTVTEALARVRASAVDAYAHQAMPFDRLITDLGSDRPALPVLVALNNYPGAGQGMAALELAPAPDETEHHYGPMLEFYSPEDVPFALGVSLNQIGEAVFGGLQYDASMFTPGTITALANQLLRLLAAVVANPDAPIALLARTDPV